MSGLNSEEEERLLPIFFEYSEQFYLIAAKLGAAKGVTYKILTTDNAPINTKQCRYSPIHREKIKKQTGELLKQGIVRSVSSYNSL